MNMTNHTEIVEERFDALEILTQEMGSNDDDPLPIPKHDEPVAGHSSMRQQERYLVRWRIAILFDGDKGKNTFHGRVNDISMGGVSIYCDHNIFHKGNVTVLLSIPPLSASQPQKILEIRSRMVYTVLSRNAFRIGLQFLRFNKGDEEFLENRLKTNHTLYRDSGLLQD